MVSKAPLRTSTAIWAVRMTRGPSPIGGTTLPGFGITATESCGPLLAGTPLNAFPYWGAAGTPVPRLDAVLPPPQAATRATASAPMNNPARVFSLIAVVCTPLSRLWALIDGVDARRQTRVTSCRES